MSTERIHLIPGQSSRCPKLNNLPTVHKRGAPLRPTLSSTRSPLKQLARFRAKQLQSHAEEAKSYVRNTGHFIERITILIFNTSKLRHCIPVHQHISSWRIGPHPTKVPEIKRQYGPNQTLPEKNLFHIQKPITPTNQPTLSPVIANHFMTHFKA